MTVWLSIRRRRSILCLSLWFLLWYTDTNLEFSIWWTLIEQRFRFWEEGMADRGIGISFELKDSRSMFFLWVFGLLAFPMNENRAAATQYKKQKLSRLFTTFKIERFSGFRIGGVSIYEPPVSLLQETVLISNRVNVPTTHPEPPAAKTFNCAIKASTCCKHSTSVSWEETWDMADVKKASTNSLSKRFPSFTALLRPRLTFVVTLSKEFTNAVILSFWKTL